MNGYFQMMFFFECELFDLYVDFGIVLLMRRVNQMKYLVLLMYSNNRNIFMWCENMLVNLNIK